MIDNEILKNEIEKYILNYLKKNNIEILKIENYNNLNIYIDNEIKNNEMIINNLRNELIKRYFIFIDINNYYDYIINNKEINKKILIELIL